VQGEEKIAADATDDAAGLDAFLWGVEIFFMACDYVIFMACVQVIFMACVKVIFMACIKSIFMTCKKILEWPYGTTIIERLMQDWEKIVTDASDDATGLKSFSCGV